MLFSLGAPAARAADSALAGLRAVATNSSFEEAVRRLEESIAANEMLLVAKASASAGAAARGLAIPGNAVLLVFRNDYAVRMLKASIPAGIEAPLRFYVTEDADGKATLSYRVPSAVFAPYVGGDLMLMAAELDRVFAKIVQDAFGQ
ncbi:MAG: DUF302 domain-containing protein [Proteobacteria bacterium]|nr:DUF302 domain-containing protein [Pseudomonadota bacterium]